MQQISPIKEKILQYIDFKGISKYKFYQDTGITRGVLDKDSGISEDNIAKFIAYDNTVNLEWLFTDKGEMFKTKSKENVVKKNDHKNDHINDHKPNVKEKLTIVKDYSEEYGRKNLIPLYDGLIAAGTNFQVDLSPQMEPVEYIDAGDWFRDATAAMRVHGESMHPEYNSGSIIAMKEVQEKRLVVYGQDYVIETSEYRVLKRLQRADDKQYWMLASVNMEVWEAGPLKGRLIHEPFDVHIDDVSRLFKVLGCVKRNESSRIVYNNGKSI
ncbi:MAG: S24 family peptidase [Bergeyella sp.]